MSAAAFFNAARAYKREITGNISAPLSQEDVDLLNAATIGRWKPAVAAGNGAPAAKTQIRLSRSLRKPAAFYGAVRGLFGKLEQSQVDGFNALLGAIGAAGWGISWAAYGLATTWHETNATMQPVEEAYWLSDGWRKRNLRYYPWHGRGYVQLTWERNYRRADAELGLDGRLIADASLAMDPMIAARVLVRGMEQGWFTDRELADYLPPNGKATRSQFIEARRIINGTDKARKIADEALDFQEALAAGEWA